MEGKLILVADLYSLMHLNTPGIATWLETCFQERDSAKNSFRSIFPVLSLSFVSWPLYLSFQVEPAAPRAGCGSLIRASLSRDPRVTHQRTRVYGNNATCAVLACERMQQCTATHFEQVYLSCFPYIRKGVLCMLVLFFFPLFRTD